MNTKNLPNNEFCPNYKNINLKYDGAIIFNGDKRP